MEEGTFENAFWTWSSQSHTSTFKQCACSGQLQMGATHEAADLCCLHAGSAITSETRFLPADQPDSEWKVILPRQNGVEYDVRHRGDHFLIEIRDEDRPNSEVLVAPVTDPTNAQVCCCCMLQGLISRVCTSAYLHALANVIIRSCAAQFKQPVIIPARLFCCHPA